MTGAGEKADDQFGAPATRRVGEESDALRGLCGQILNLDPRSKHILTFA